MSDKSFTRLLTQLGVKNNIVYTKRTFIFTLINPQDIYAQRDTIEYFQNLGIISLSLKSRGQDYNSIPTVIEELISAEILLNIIDYKKYISTTNILNPSIEIYFIWNQDSIKNINFHSRKGIVVISFLKIKTLHNKYIFITTNDIFENKISEYSIETENLIREYSTILIKDFILPEYFEIEGYDEVDIKDIFDREYRLNTLLCLASNSTENEKYNITIKGYKTIQFSMPKEELQKNLLKLDKRSINDIYKWVFNNTNNASEEKLKILRYLLSLECYDLESLIAKLSTASFLKSAQHQFDLILKGNIKEHFDNVTIIYEKMREVSNNINGQIEKLTTSINTILLGIGGVVISIGTDLNIGLPIILVLIFYMIYQIIIVNETKNEKKILIEQYGKYKDILVIKINAIDKELAYTLLDNPIKEASRVFDKKYINTIRILYTALFISLGVLIILLGKFDWIKNINYYNS